MLLGLFNRIFFPMHYKNAYDLGKPFVVSSAALALGMVILETLQHVLPYLKDVCDSYEAADQLRQLPVLFGGLLALRAADRAAAFPSAFAALRTPICKRPFTKRS